MILYSDDYAEIYRQMSEEEDTIAYWTRKYSKRILKDFKRSPKVPVWTYKIVTMPRTLNRYLLFYYALTRLECIHETCFAGAVLLLDDDKGRPVALQLKHFTDTDDRDIHVESLQIYTGHFFSRYKERYNWQDQLSRYELMTTFFGRNAGYLMEVDYNKFVLQKDRIPNGTAFGMDDGVSLATKEWITLDSGKEIFITKHNTFLSRKHLKEDQTAILPSQDAMRAKLLTHFQH